MTPRWIAREIRVRVLMAGGYPGNVKDFTIQAAEMSLYTDLGRNWLHSDYLPKYCGNCAMRWKRLSMKHRKSIQEEAERRLNCASSNENNDDSSGDAGGLSH